MAGSGYRGGAKRRPRSEWLIQHDTHAALITTEEAETILERLAKGRASRYRTRPTYLLSGILVTPEGKPWHGAGDGYYRAGKGRRLQQAPIEQAVLDQVGRDLLSPAFVAELLRETQRIAASPPDENLARLRGEINALSATLAKLTDLATQTENPRPFLERIEELEPKRARLKEELKDLEADHEATRVLTSLTEADVTALLTGLASHLAEVDQDAVKELLEGIIERITLDPESHQCQIHYRIDTGEFLASPRGFEPRLLP